MAHQRIPCIIPRIGGRRASLSHPADTFDIMMNHSTDEQKRKAIEAFAAAERALREAGIRFTVVEAPEYEVSDPPLAA